MLSRGAISVSAPGRRDRGDPRRRSPHYRPEAIAERAQRFWAAAFRARLLRVLADELERRRPALAGSPGARLGALSLGDLAA
jgi:hypothetical protein